MAAGPRGVGAFYAARAGARAHRQAFAAREELRLARKGLEAALVDGAGNFSLMFRIALPLVKKTFMILWLLTFISLWNDYQGPMIYLPSYPTVAYGLYRFSQISSGALNSIPMRMAGCMLLFIPIFIIYLCLQDKLMGNLTIGGVKG